MSEGKYMSFNKADIELKECPSDEKLKLFFQKKIEGQEIRDISEHVMHCADCVLKLHKMMLESRNDKK